MIGKNACVDIVVGQLDVFIQLRALRYIPIHSSQQNRMVAPLCLLQREIWKDLKCILQDVNLYTGDTRVNR